MVDYVVVFDCWVCVDGFGLMYDVFVVGDVEEFGGIVEVVED